MLTETKHRGAFEQAHVGFSQLCSRLWRLSKTNLNELPKLWLHQILISITGIKENSKLCATRRSVGVPFMIQVNEIKYFSPDLFFTLFYESYSYESYLTGFTIYRTSSIQRYKNYNL